MGSHRGVSTTEYVLLLVMIGIFSMLAVKSFGVKIKQLWSDSGNQLSTLTSVFDEEVEEPALPQTGLGLRGDEDNGDIQEPEDNNPPNDCAERFAAMDLEYDQQTAVLSAQIDAAQGRYDAAMAFRMRYRRAGRWGGFGYWTREYIHPPEVRQAAEQQLQDARAIYDDFEADWQSRYQQLQSECGD